MIAGGPRTLGSPAEPRPRLLVVVGATGCGKSALAVELAEILDGEIVGCDALQVYRDFDVATAKPTAAERARVPHHLVDHVDPRTDYSLADWVREAERVVAEIAARGRVPIVVGGTGLYLRGLLRGVVDAPGRNAELRRRLRRMARRRGTAALHRWLARIDADSAARLAARDEQRIVRALELALGAGPSWSARLAAEGTWSAPTERYAALKLGLELPREALVERLDRRVERFFVAGLVREVAGLLARVPREANAFKAIGYREVAAALDAGGAGAETFDQVQRNTRRYAKRQRTWFRSESGVIWLDGMRPLAELAEVVRRLWLERQGRRDGA